MQDDKSETRTIRTRDLLMTFLFPMLVGKVVFIFVGAEYASNPGEGWGYLLTAVGLFTLAMIARFLWRYRNYRD